MLQLSLCRINDIKDFDIQSAVTVPIPEGAPLVGSLVSGEQQAKFYTTGSDVFLGFAYGETQTPVYTSYVEDVVCPAVSPYTIHLTKNNLVTDKWALYNLTSGSAVVLNTGYSIVAATGVITVTESDLYGCTIRVTYRYAPTVLEQQALYRINPLPQSAVATLYKVGVILAGENSEVYTDQYDAAFDWNAFTGLKADANGLVVDAAGTGATISGTVIHIPTPDIPFLGIRF